MQMLRSNRLTNIEYWEAAKENILGSQRAELADSLFSIPEGVWHNIRWRTDTDIQKANNSGFNVTSTLYLDISDPLDTENRLQGKLNKAYYRLSTVEKLCCDMYSHLRKNIGSLSAADADDFDEKWTARMDALGLVEGDVE